MFGVIRMEVNVDLVSEDLLASMTTMEKIRMVLDKVKGGDVVVLEGGLRSDEAMKLIEITMMEIDDEFKGIEMESYPTPEQVGILARLLGKKGKKSTIVASTGQLKMLEKKNGFLSIALIKS